MGCRFVILISIIFSSLQALAFPLPSEHEAALAEALWQQPLLSDDGYDFTNIVRLNNCSGSLVRFDDSLPTDHAMVLTNGHCIGRFPAPGLAVVGIEVDRSIALLNESAKTIGNVDADLLMYATMTKTDMALYRLTATFADLKSRYNLDALEIAREPSPITTPIQVLSGYWRVGFSCSIEKIVHQLKEEDWTCEDSIRYSQPGCAVYGGTSGSPILSAERKVIGVNNTGNESGYRCTENNPCEIDEAGNVDYEQGRSYGQQIFWIYGCLNAAREIDVRQSTCLLPH